jgi:hypothetical protein
VLSDLAKASSGTLLLLTALAATPATRPADKDTVQIVAGPAKARFRVPLFWQRRPVTGLPDDQAFLFDPTPATSNKAKRPTMQQLVEVMLTPAGPGPVTAKDLGDRARAKLLAGKPDLKFVKDAPGTFAGRAVWVLQFSQKVPLRTPDGKAVGTLEYDRVQYVWPEHNADCHVGLHADPRYLPSLQQKVDPIVRGLVWDD